MSANPYGPAGPGVQRPRMRERHDRRCELPVKRSRAASEPRGAGLPREIWADSRPYTAVLVARPILVSRAGLVVDMVPKDGGWTFRCVEGQDFHTCTCPKYQRNGWTCPHLTALQLRRIVRGVSRWGCTGRQPT